jgi:hypothetical protein
MNGRCRRTRSLVPALVLVALTSIAGAAQRAVLAPHAPGPIPEHTLWHPITLTFRTAVNTDESLHAPGANPFLDYRLRVTFRHPASARRLVVNGFYAADGNAADTGETGGNVWQARFTPDRTGDWLWSAEFRRGAGIVWTAAACRSRSTIPQRASGRRTTSSSRTTAGA